MTTYIRRVLIVATSLLVVGSGMSLSVTAGPLTSLENLPFDIHGFLSLGYLDSSKNNYFAGTKDGTGDFREFGLNASKSFTPKLRVGAQIVARTLGDVGDDEVVLDWAVMDYHWHDNLGIRIGKIKMPLGLHNQTRDVDALRTSILLPQSIYPEQLRDTLSALVGVGLYGELPIGEAFGSLSYEVQAGRFDIPDESGVVKLVESGGNFTTEGFDEETSYLAALQWQLPVEGARIAYAYFEGQLLADTIATAENSYGIPAMTPVTLDADPLCGHWWSAEYELSDWLFTSEFNIQDRDTDVGGLTSTKARLEGWYAGAEHRFFDRYVGGVTYSEYYNDRNDKSGQRYISEGTPAHRAWQKEWVFSLKAEVTDNLILKIEEHIIDGTASLFASDNTAPTAQNWNMFAVKATLIF